MRLFAFVVSIATLLACAEGCFHKGITYSAIDHFWEIEDESYLDSVQFFSRDSLFFIHDMYNSNPQRSTYLDINKSEKIFSIGLKDRGLHGFYTIDRYNEQLILTTCETPSDDENQ